MRKNLLAVLAATVMILGVSACSDDDGGGGDSALRSEIKAEMTAGGEISDDDADCMIDKLFDKYSAEELQALVDADEGGDGPPDALMEDMMSITLECVDISDLMDEG